MRHLAVSARRQDVMPSVMRRKKTFRSPTHLLSPMTGGRLESLAVLFDCSSSLKRFSCGVRVPSDHLNDPPSISEGECLRCGELSMGGFFRAQL